MLFSCVLPFLILPLIIGGYLLSPSSASPLTYFMALLTLKPLLATPLWLLLMQLSVDPTRTDPMPDVVLYALPGISLTLLIFLSCWPRLKGQPIGIIAVLLVLDILRCGSTIVTQGGDGYFPPLPEDGLRPLWTLMMPSSVYANVAWVMQWRGEILAIMSVTMPSVFALFAWLMNRSLERTLPQCHPKYRHLSQYQDVTSKN